MRYERYIFVWVGLCLFAFLLSCSFERNYERGNGEYPQSCNTAILPLLNLTSYPYAGRIVGELLTTEIYMATDFAIMEQTEMLQKLDTLDAETDQILEKSSALKIGKKLGVDTVIFGAVTEYRYKKYLIEKPVVGINLRMLDVERNEILWAGSKSAIGGWFLFCEVSLNRLTQKICYDLIQEMIEYGNRERHTVAPSPNKHMGQPRKMPLQTMSVNTSDVTIPPEEADKDKDGVADALDKCSETAVDVLVDEFGCPRDSDKDGVSDDMDRCPDTPKSSNVDSSGCVVDNDGDGVNNNLDQCNDTPKGATVDDRGCWVIKGIGFKSRDWTVDSAYFPLLDDIFLILENTPELNIIIEGHSDSSGSIVENRLLSERRAQSIMNYLIEKGIAPDRIAARGSGASKPVATNATEEGQALNRRVEIRPFY